MGGIGNLSLGGLGGLGGQVGPNNIGPNPWAMPNMGPNMGDNDDTMMDDDL